MTTNQTPEAEAEIEAAVKRVMRRADTWSQGPTNWAERALKAAIRTEIKAAEERGRLAGRRDALEPARKLVAEHQAGAMYPRHKPTCNCVDLCAWAKPLLAALATPTETKQEER